MTSSNQSISFQNLLSRFSAFSSLESDNLLWLAERAKPFHCSIGQELLSLDRMPDYCYCILDGRGRVLHNDPGLRRPVTLAYSQPGDLIGWAGLTRRSSCEWISAVTPMRLIGFSASDFYELESKSKAFSTWIDSNNSPAELMAVLARALRLRPNAHPPERDVLRRLLPGMQLIPARTQRHIPPNDGLVWLWNSIHEDYSIPTGSLVDSTLLASIPAGFPLRLICINQKLWEQEINPKLEAPTESFSSYLNDPWEGHDRYADLLAPAPQGEKRDDLLLDSKLNSKTEINWKRRKIPVVTGFGPLEQAMACLEMLSAYHNVPFRRDVVQRAVREALKDHSCSLEQLGNLAAWMGFVGTLADVPVAQLHRLAFPCFAIAFNQPAVIHDISRTEVKAVIPEYGCVSISIEDFRAGLEGVRILSLSPGRDSQRRKLNLAWFLPQITKYRRSLIEVLAASLVMQLLNLAQPLIMQQIFDKVIVQQNLDTLYTLGIVLLGVSLFQGLLGAVRTYLFADTTNRIDITLGAQVIQHLLKLPLGYFDRRPVGELQTRISELGNIRGFLTGSLLTLALDAVFSIIYVAVMIIYSGVLTAVTLAIVPLFLGLTIIASPLIKDQLRKAAERNAATQSLLVETLNGVQTIKAQSAENSVRWEWQKRYSSFMSESFRSLMIGVSAGTVGSFLNQLTGLITLWVGAFLVIKGELTIGQLIAFRIISGYVVGPLLNLATSWQSFQGVSLSIERLSDVIDAPAEGSDSEMDQLPLPPISGEVVFQEVDFRFNESAPLVVNNICFSVQPGSFVGVVGRSGSGKSTIMKLLPRLYEPEKGRILIDGYDINKLQLSSVRRQIGIVPQDSLLFEGTIRDNIALTSPDSNSDDIVAAARVADAHDFIMELASGYATRIGEKGAGLSGGQKQRIAIARAVLQKPKLLILDEATSALDYLTERQVCNNLKREFEGSTVFFITHRLSTIRNSDQILMLDHGSLVEQGTHDELLELQGRYFALYSQQESNIE